MAFIEWNDSLSVKIGEIDDDHKRMICVINRLHQAMIDNRGRAVQKEIINEVHDYARHHFALEERYMRRFNYPDTDAHLKEHEEFASEAAGLKAAADGDRLVLTATILFFLKDWLNNHILGTDLKYAEHFRRCGLS